MVETLGEEFDAGWQARVKCDRHRDGIKSSRSCPASMVLDLETMLWTHGRAYPIGRLSEYLKCPSCGNRSASSAVG